MWRAALNEPAKAEFDWQAVCQEAFHKRRSMDRFRILEDCRNRILQQSKPATSEASAAAADKK